jgi:hypothetical protein
MDFVVYVICKRKNNLADLHLETMKDTFVYNWEANIKTYSKITPYLDTTRGDLGCHEEKSRMKTVIYRRNRENK